MTFANPYAYANYFDMPNVENFDLEAPMHQDQFVPPCSLDPFEYPENFALFSASDYGMGSAYSATIAGNTETLQLNRGALKPTNHFCLSQGDDVLSSSLTGTDQKAKAFAPLATQSPTPASTWRPRNRRRQNRSCDPCRSAKRACDLPPDAPLSNPFPLLPCSMCKLRGTECTVTWRASRRSFYPKKLAAENGPGAGIEHVGDAVSATTPSLASSESRLFYHVIARDTCSQRLGVYFDIFDIPMSKFLSQKCIPPSHSLGITALTHLGHNANLAALFTKTQSSIRNCWEMAPSLQLPVSVASRVFLTASILDALFQRRNTQSECGQSTLRDMSLTETFKWVAIAAGSQFAVHQNGPESTKMSHKQSRDIAYATWCKAKHMVFMNIAARTSIRLGLSLLLFGTILPPTETDRSHVFEEDASYAFHEGICQLQMLCAEARDHLSNCDIQPDINTSLMGRFQPGKKPHLLQSLTSETRKNVLELITAFEWLVEISQSVAIILFPRRSFTATPSINNFKARGTHPVEKIVQRTGVEGAENERNLKSIDDSIITRVKANAYPITVLWRQGSAHLVDSALLDSASLVILMWKSLARLVLAIRDFWIDEVECSEIYQHFNAMITLIDLWRKTFGKIDRDAAMSLQQATTDLRRSAIFCATDGDLAILLFYEISCQLQKRLTDQPHSPRNSLCERLKLTSGFRHSQRLASAIQISYLSTTNLGISSPGFQGKAGLKAGIEDLRAHPVSWVRIRFLRCDFLKLIVTHSTPLWWYKHTN